MARHLVHRGATSRYSNSNSNSIFNFNFVNSISSLLANTKTNTNTASTPAYSLLPSAPDAIELDSISPGQSQSQPPPSAPHESFRRRVQMALQALGPTAVTTSAEDSTLYPKNAHAVEKSTANGNDSDLESPSHSIQDGAVLEKGTLDPVYEAKARVLNHAVRARAHAPVTSTNKTQIQEIGMGWYQWQLFAVVGFGWANDNLWPIVTSLIRTFRLSLSALMMCEKATHSHLQCHPSSTSSTHPVPRTYPSRRTSDFCWEPCSGALAAMSLVAAGHST